MPVLQSMTGLVQCIASAALIAAGASYVGLALPVRPYYAT